MFEGVGQLHDLIPTMGLIDLAPPALTEFLGKPWFVSFARGPVHEPALHLFIFIGRTTAFPAVLDFPAIDVLAETDVYIQISLADFVRELGQSHDRSSHVVGEFHGKQTRKDNQAPQRDEEDGLDLPEVPLKSLVRDIQEEGPQPPVSVHNGET